MGWNWAKANAEWILGNIPWQWNLFEARISQESRAHHTLHCKQDWTGHSKTPQGAIPHMQRELTKRPEGNTVYAHTNCYREHWGMADSQNLFARSDHSAYIMWWLVLDRTLRPPLPTPSCALLLARLTPAPDFWVSLDENHFSFLVHIENNAEIWSAALHIYLWHAVAIYNYLL